MAELFFGLSGSTHKFGNRPPENSKKSLLGLQLGKLSVEVGSSSNGHVIQVDSQFGPSRRMVQWPPTWITILSIIWQR